MSYLTQSRQLFPSQQIKRVVDEPSIKNLNLMKFQRLRVMMTHLIVITDKYRQATSA